jgi:hypothetical protein
MNKNSIYMTVILLAERVSTIRPRSTYWVLNLVEERERIQHPSTLAVYIYTAICKRSSGGGRIGDSNGDREMMEPELRRY